MRFLTWLNWNTFRIGWSLVWQEHKALTHKLTPCLVTHRFKWVHVTTGEVKEYEYTEELGR